MRRSGYRTCEEQSSGCLDWSSERSCDADLSCQDDHLERMALKEPSSIKERALKRAVIYALKGTVKSG